VSQTSLQARATAWSPRRSQRDCSNTASGALPSTDWSRIAQTNHVSRIDLSGIDEHAGRNGQAHVGLEANPLIRSPNLTRCLTNPLGHRLSTTTADDDLDVGPSVSRRCTPGNHRGDVEPPRRRPPPSPHAASSVELRRSTPPSTPGRVREDVDRAGHCQAASTRVRPQPPCELDAL